MADGIPCWTDYPIAELGDEPGKIAPIRPCTCICWDGDKLALVAVGTVRTTFKVGYLYPREQRCGDGPSIKTARIPIGEIYG